MKNSFRLTVRKHVHVALFAGTIAFLPWAAHAGTWNVGDYAALTNAITSAVNGDTIAISQNITVSNAVAISGKGLTIEGNDYSISVPIPGFDESGLTNGGSASTFGVFNIDAVGKTNFIQNLTVKGGNAAGAINNASGGTLVLEDMTIAQSGGPSQGGGGLYNSGTLYLQSCNVSRNGAQYGGGFLNDGTSSTMFIEDCTFSENRSLSPGGGGGGGVNMDGNLYANNSTFVNNKSTELGGAFENYLGSTTSLFVNCTFAGNIAYNTSATLKGGAIAQNGGVVTVVNSLFAYNYWNNSGTYVLNDLENYSGTGTNISAYYCVFHSTTNQLLISVSNTLYAGATNGSDDSIFAGGANAIVLDAGGAPLGTNTIYQPFLVRLTATNLPTALLQSNASPSFAVSKGCRAAFSSSQTTPVVGYYSNNTQWVDLSGTNSPNFEVLDDQNGMNRTNSLIVGAAVGTASNLFMLKVVATNGGTVSGASVYGDIYPSGTVVTVTAIPAVSNLFVRWDYALGGSGTASSNNPYLVAVNTNITLLPVFSNFNGFTITYSGNGYTGGTVPSQQVVTNGGSTNISGPGTMVKEDYHFSSWNTRSDGNGTDYASGAGYSGPGNLMLYAKWLQLTQMAVLGTNGAAIASGEAANMTKGTDFGTFIITNAVITNTLSITNSGNGTLTISGWTTNGTGANAFTIAGIPATVSPGAGSNFTMTFNPSVVGTHTASVSIVNNSTNTSYVVNLRGVVESAPTPDGWLAINVTPESGSWALNAPAGYTGPTSSTGSLATVSAVTGQYGVSYGALSGYVAPSNQAGFVTGGSTTLFAGVYLQISTNIGTPAGVSATEGTYTNRIRITWQGVAGATGYELWRSRTNDANTAGRIADIPENGFVAISDGVAQARALQDSESKIANAWKSGNAYIYDDYNINPINAYYYWVRAKTATLISPMSYVGMGYAALDPNAAAGTADIGVSDFVFLPVNVTNASHAGTVSCWLANVGPDALNSSGVEFGFYMGSNAAAMVWIGSAQSDMTLSAGGEELIILTPFAKRGLTVRGDLSGVQMVKVTARHLSMLNDPNLANNTAAGVGQVTVKSTGVNSPGRSFNDYDGDGKADVAVFGNAGYRWYVALSGARYGSWLDVETGSDGWTPVPGDYDGDGITDMALYERLNGYWLVRFTSSGLLGDCWLGGPAFTVVQCDFDGDAMTDPLVYREADGYWLGAASSRQYALCDTSLGETGYQPVVADYDGDGLADPAVYNRTTGFWAISLSGRGYQPLVTGTFGGSDYLPVSADYDGDGLADPAIYAPATANWQVLPSTSLAASLAAQGRYATLWDGVVGAINGLPVPADYDGDGLADPAVYHEDTGIWEIFFSTYDYQKILGGYFGGPTCQPAVE